MKVVEQVQKSIREFVDVQEGTTFERLEEEDASSVRWWRGRCLREVARCIVSL